MRSFGGVEVQSFEDGQTVVFPARVRKFPGENDRAQKVDKTFKKPGFVDYEVSSSTKRMFWSKMRSVARQEVIQTIKMVDEILDDIQCAREERKAATTVSEVDHETLRRHNRFARKALRARAIRIDQWGTPHFCY